MKTVFLIRHGEVEYPRNEKGESLVYGPTTPLSDLGRKQLEVLGKEFVRQKIKIEAIYSSSYRRAIESSEFFMKNLYYKTPLILTGELRDVDNFGWHGKTMKEYSKLSGDVYSHPLNKKDESLERLSTRGLNVFKKIIKNKYNSLAIVSHGDFLSALVWRLEHKRSPLNYKVMKKNFYPEKGQAVLYEVNQSLKKVKRVKLITIEEVKKSIEYWRK